MMMKRIPLVNVKNMRDLGGYPTANGDVTQFGRFFRSSALIGLLEEEVDHLQQIGVRTFIDLRTTAEVKQMPNDLSSHPSFNYYHLSLMEADVEVVPNTEEGIPVSYLEMADNHQAMRQIFQTLANAPGAIVFHCTAGKDRTGTVAALLLSLVGVAREDVLADYQVTYTYIRKQVEEMIARFDFEVPAFAGYSKYEYMDEFLNLFARKYGDVENYLETIGLDEVDIFLLKDRLISKLG